MITPDQNAELRSNAKNMVRDALKAAADLPKPSIDVMFDNVYKTMPPHIINQKEELRSHLQKYPDNYELDHFLDGKKWIK